MTYHCLERAKERAGLSVNAALNLFDKAVRYGIGADEFPANERNYLKSKEGNGMQAIFYGEYIFILNDEGRCVTMYRAPGWFGKKSNFHGKEQIKNKKRFARFHKDILL